MGFPYTIFAPNFQTHDRAVFKFSPTDTLSKRSWYHYKFCNSHLTMPTFRQRRAAFKSGFLQEFNDPKSKSHDCPSHVVLAGILTPIVGLIWGLIAKMTLIKIRPSDGYSWFECCQHRDISELFLESYYTANMLMGLTAGVIILCNYLVFQINERTGYYLYSRQVALMLQIPANIAPVFLVGLLVFDEHSWYMVHMLCAMVAFASFVMYFICTAVFFGITLLQKPERRTSCNMFSVIYFVIIPLLCVSCLRLWRAGRGCTEVGSSLSR